MDFRKTFSKPFKKLKDKLPGGDSKRDGRSWSKDGSRAANDEGSEVGQKNSHPHLGVVIGGAVESGPSREGNNIDGKKVALINVNPPTPIPSISHIGEPDSM